MARRPSLRRNAYVDRAAATSGTWPFSLAVDAPRFRIGDGEAGLSPQLKMKPARVS